MANLLVEEPDALVCARPDLWEPREGNDPGPPGPRQNHRFGFVRSVDMTDASCACTEKGQVLPPDIGNGSDEQLPILVVKPITEAASAELRETTLVDGTDAPKSHAGTSSKTLCHRHGHPADM